MSHFEIHITVHDKAVDKKNGKKARGSTWHKEHRERRKSRKGGKRRITAHDRAVDKKNGKKSRGSSWKEGDL